MAGNTHCPSNARGPIARAVPPRAPASGPTRRRSPRVPYDGDVDLDAVLRRHLYDITLARGLPPSIAEIASAASISETDVLASLESLAAGRILVRQPASGEILMLPPFSAVPTPFVVETSQHRSYANCAWDALGVSVMLHEPARLVTACGCCGERITLDVTVDQPPASTDVIHFAVPAARWWHDMVFT